MTAASAKRYQMNTVMLCLTTNRSNQAIDAYATTKLTPVAKTVGNHPTPVLITVPSLIASYAPAATRAGIARKKASRVAATRSRSRNMPALMVVPERDTPGIRATHCTKPMITASFRLNEDSGRSRLPTRSAIHITALQPTSATTTTHRLRKGPEIRPWARKPTIPIGIEPRMTYHANR